MNLPLENANSSQYSSRPMLSEINVTPFVDIMLVLLIIFMVTAPMMQQGLNVNLPETKAQSASISKNPFILVIQSNGKIFIDTSSSFSAKSSTEIPLEDLGKKLKAIVTARKDQNIYIQADKKVSYERVAAALAELQLVGLTKVSLITSFKSH